ncbi:MAG: cytochrome b N-terminal domain-containing protein [Candidatus Obscuribacterales bacterium]|nr:cytochrome b N-terminal domain-containing protein [Candidatus Obscuribacterales bacterium]
MPSTADAKSSSLAGALTKAGDWLQTRLNNIDIFDEHHHQEAKTNPFYSLGGIFYLVWFLVILSGCVLIMWYVPTKPAAFDSILHIQHEILFGNIWRGVHKYGADAMIIAATMRLFRMFICADYKPGKEFNIAIALVTLLLSMYSGLTGYLLIWNQRAFWATKVFATFPTYMDQFPVMGDYYLPLVKSLHLGWNTAEFLLGAGGAITQETITRFFSIHMAFSAIPLILVELYFYRTGFKRIPFNWTKRIIVTMMLVIVAIIMPAALGHRSNPDVTPLPILSDWYFLGLYQMYKYLEPVVATEITMVIPISVILLPFIDVWATGAEKDIHKRPFIFYVALMGFVCWIVFSVLIIVNIANIHYDPPYWRSFLWGLIDVGILMQLFVYTKSFKTVQEKAVAVKGCIAMGVLAAIQTFWAVVYYYMAITEMFFGPLTQGWTYGLCKMLGSVAKGDEVEKLVALASNSDPANKANFNPNYWDYQSLHHLKDYPGKENIEAIYAIANNPNAGGWLDPLFNAIPSFMVVDKAGVPTPVPYVNTLDYMVSNRWCADYITFCNRMTPGTEKSVSGAFYPLTVPEIDWIWMVLGAVTTVACIVMIPKMKAPQEPAKTVKTETASAAS